MRKGYKELLQTIGTKCKHSDTLPLSLLKRTCRDEQTYAGAYVLDKATGNITGCPAQAPAIHDLMKAVKTRAGTKGAAATRKHAEVMSLEDLQKVMRWSEKQCPNELFNNAPSSPQSVALMNTHGLMRALCPTLFVLMLRYDEVGF